MLVAQAKVEGLTLVTQDDVTLLNLKQGDQMTKSYYYRKTEPHYFSDMKDGAFCFTGLDLKL